ncbi:MULTISPECIES: nucleotide exchange factor GrpE [unclassified Coleofasciculus]|uniref:nucleotide exchange factor GrpE n=1 Tax=unclassified Coleofasciculus TaxID=2692782 RepID=UPI00187F5FF8|nr:MULTISPECIES: nucleotide exchange factor GrpE [unclassified Coleofasciculus]MBE9128670.1 nucleotide exchange factor GrpE [Coleofasciculus sp. LEGE 07081]MBE9147160.1 nucleotide exchange factor GrpE [Coleofasciculus sp. LEGE 07092]
MEQKEELFERFLACLQATETAPPYLGEEPEEPIPPFDPYQMVGEWIALRQELKQQGKLLKSAQATLQKALDAAQTDKEQLQTQLAESQQREAARWEKEHDKWLRDLLGIVDALEQACEYCQKTEAEALPMPSPPRTLGQNLDRWLVKVGWQSQTEPQEHDTKAISNIGEILSSQREGIEVIRRMMLDLLRQHQVVPMEAIGQPFDPALMCAVSRIESDEAISNTVAQEVVRGYLWKGRILREAQVIVFQSPKQ